MTTTEKCAQHPPGVSAESSTPKPSSSFQYRTVPWLITRAVWPVVRRNQVRDFLDVAALSERFGIPHAAAVLSRIDRYYSDQRQPEAEGVATQLARQLADPRPADYRTIGQLGQYKALDARLTDWRNVTEVCRSIAVEMAL